MFRDIKPSFSSGELSPAMYGRVDLAKYQTGLKKAFNFIVKPQGGIENRPGTMFVAKAPGTGRVIEFSYNVEQSYFLEFTDYMMRVIKDGGLVLRPLSTSAWKWTASGSGTNEYYLETAADASPGFPEPAADEVYAGATLLTVGTAGSLAAGEWDWADNDTLGFSTIYVRLSGGTDPDAGTDYAVSCVCRVSSPYAVADLATLRYMQSADTLFLTHPGYAPLTLTRTDHFEWSFDPIIFEPVATPPTTVTATYSATAGSPNRTMKYVVAAIVNGEESAPSAAASVSVDSPWASGEKVAVAWTAVTGAEAYNIYKSSRGFFGWIGTVAQNADGFYLAKYDSELSGATTKTTMASVKSAIVTLKGAAGLVFGGGGDPSVTVQWDETGQTTWNTVFDSTISTKKQIEITFPTAGQYDIKITPGGGGKVTLVSIRQFGEILSYTDDNVEPDISDGPRELYDPFDGEGYPAACGLFEQRTIYGGGTANPQTVWASQTGVLNNFSTSRPLKDTDSIKVTIASRQVNEIRHIVPLDKLIILTSGAEWIMSPGSNAEALSPTSVQFRVQSYRGCSEVPPLVIGQTVLFVQRDGSTIQDLGYSFAVDKYETSNLSVLAQHLFQGRTVKEWAYQQRPNSVIWCVMSDGALLSFTYMKEHEIWGWCEHETDGEFVSIASAPGLDDDDDVCFMIKRTIDSTDVYYVETMAERLPDGVLEDGVFLDSALTYSGTAVSSVSGLDHLEGEDVWALADGSVVKGLTVTSGAVTIPHDAAKIHVGLPIPTPQIEMLPLAMQGSAGRKMRVNKVFVRCEKTRGFWAGPNEDRMVEAKWRSNEVYGDPTEALTGDKEILVQGQWGYEGSLVIQVRDPLPVTINAIVPEVDFGG